MAPNSSRRSLLATRVAQTFALALTCAVCAELTARIDDYVRYGVPITRTPDLNNDLVLHDSLGSRGRPYGRYMRWKLNSAGFRSDESVLTPKPGCTRVMTLGASETFGAAGESPGKEYPSQLADSLSRHGCYQVLNAAMEGTAIPGLIHLWNVWASRFRPDIAVILAGPSFYLGDQPPAESVAVARRPPPRGPWWTPRLLSKVHQVIHYPAFIQRRRVQRQLAELVSGRPPEWFFTVAPSDRLAQYRRDLDSLITTIQSHGVEPVLAVYPIRFGSSLSPQDRDFLAAWREFSPRALPDVMLAFDSAAGDVVRDLGRLRHLRVVDLSKTMNGHREWFDDFIHYTDSGAGVVAGQVGQVVRTMVEGRRHAAQEAISRAPDAASQVSGGYVRHSGRRDGVLH